MNPLSPRPDIVCGQVHLHLSELQAGWTLSDPPRLFVTGRNSLAFVEFLKACVPDLSSETETVLIKNGNGAHAATDVILFPPHAELGSLLASLIDELTKLRSSHPQLVQLLLLEPAEGLT